ncbi:Ankrd17, partial [Symbiodinium sp. KB8]
ARLTPLHWAARHGNAELVRLLLAHGAVLEAKSAVVRLLLDSGADLEARDEDEFSPFLFAAASGHPEVLRLLLERGADAKARSVVRSPADPCESRLNGEPARPRKVILPQWLIGHEMRAGRHCAPQRNMHMQSDERAIAL